MESDGLLVNGKMNSSTQDNKMKNGSTDKNGIGAPSNKEPSEEPKDSSSVTDVSNQAEKDRDITHDEKQAPKDKKKSTSNIDSAVRSIALWRMVFFCIMMYEWPHDQVLTPFGSIDLEMDTANGSAGKDRWFAYNQFEWIQDIHQFLGRDANRASLLNQGGLVLCFLAAFGKELCIPGWVLYTSLFTIIYLIRFLAKATNFTNHNYLFPLLMTLTIFSGGGRLFGKQTLGQRQSCQAAVVVLRAQLAVMYLFASLWKIHSDWFAGRIVSRIFLSFQKTNKSRGIPWDAVQEAFPQVFVFLAVGGFLLDASMAAVLCFGKPTPSSTKLFLVFTLIFHLSTSLTMAQIIGYAFPLTCISGLMLFLPLTQQDDGGKVIPYDRSLISWLTRYTGDLFYSSKDSKDDKSTVSVSPNRWQKWLVLSWVVWQLYMPLRMIVLSKGEFAYNRIAYRYSWTMMLHDLDYGIIQQHSNAPDTILLLAYYVPTCFLRGRTDMYLPRQLYLGSESEHPMQDGRTVPMHQILGTRESAMLEVFPSHLVHRVGAGVARVLDAMVGEQACAQIKGLPESVLPLDPRLGMHAVYFGRLNGNGPYSRLMDPTVNLVSVLDAQRKQSYLKTLWNAFLDQRPDGNEFIFRRGVGSLREAAQKHAIELKQHFPDKTVQFLADRASCLHARPLWLSPLGNPYGFVPLRLPFGTSLSFKSSGPTVELRQIELGKLNVLASTSLEIGITGLDPKIAKPCGETIEEDILIAIIF